VGLILAVVVHAADIQDYDGSKLVFERIRGRFSRLRLVWADGIYKRMVGWVACWRPACPIRLQIVEQTEPGFKVLKRRCVVERTFAWLGRCRQLSKDYEGKTDSSKAWVKLAMIHLMARRLVRNLYLSQHALTSTIDVGPRHAGRDPEVEACRPSGMLGPQVKSSRVK